MLVYRKAHNSKLLFPEMGKNARHAIDFILPTIFVKRGTQAREFLCGHFKGDLIRLHDYCWEN